MNNILCPREKVLLAHKWYIPQDTRDKIHSFYLKVWSSSYTLSRIDLNQCIEDQGILYRVNSRYKLADLRQSKEIGLSFRALTESSGYVILKPWSINTPLKETESYGI